ncbi:MAG: hypothetical protein EXS02_04075 [Planctomycetes bacterium]|nr:hypothetical protein [Planctomycetota bacterium]
MQKLTLLGCVFATAFSVLAQSAPAGFTYNVMTGATSRGPQGAGPVQILFRIDRDDYRSYGNASAGSNQVLGAQIIMQDQYALIGGQEQYDIRLYGEDLATPRPSFPNFAPDQPVGTNELVHMGPFTTPVGGTIADPRGAWVIAVAFATPIALPNNQDIFIGVQFQAAGAANASATPTTWPNDGLSLHTSLGAGGLAAIFDDKGQGAISGGVTANSYMLVHDVANSIYSYAGGAHQGQADLLVSSTVGRGVITVVTNQVSYSLTNTLPGTASFFSALHPDARAVPLHPGRADTVGYTYLGAPAGNLIFYLLNFGFGASPIELGTLVPGSSGMACLDLASAITLGFQIAGGSNVDTMQFPLSPAARRLIGGTNLAFQGITFDAANNILRAAACGAVKF